MNKFWVCLTVLLFNHVCHAELVDTLSYGIFGKMIVYHPAQKPSSIALFVSGDGGWEPGVDHMAKHLAEEGALVVGVDAKNLKKSFAKTSGQCLYPAADFEQLSLMIQKKYNFATYQKPILAGFSYGATLIYGLLAQAPANTFKGGIALGFCPDIDINKPLCGGAGFTSLVLKEGHTYYLERSKGLTAPFIVLNGLKDQNCPYTPTRDFLQDLPKTELITLPKVGHGFSVEANWLPQFKTAYRKILASPSYTSSKGDKEESLKIKELAGSPGNLPLTILPTEKTNDLPVIFFISGDGGWTSFDQSLCEQIVKRDMPVIGLDVQKYFWKAKTPDQATRDITLALSFYMHKWKKTTFVLVGYSFGASVVPFIADRLPGNFRPAIRGILALSPDETTDFEVHIIDMLNLGSNDKQYDVLAELQKVKKYSPVCIFGSEESNTASSKLKTLGIKTIIIPGGHHYDNAFSTIINHLLQNIQTKTP